MKKKKETPGGLVYSTNPGFRPDAGEEPAADTPAPENQQLRVSLDKKNRGGKEVTLVTGFVGTAEDLEILGKTLKNKCGTGGSAKDGEIIIQGDKRKVVAEYLAKEKYRVKLV